MTYTELSLGIVIGIILSLVVDVIKEIVVREYNTRKDGDKLCEEFERIVQEKF
ncbi:MAG: hypothetical protein ACXQTY_05410 [Candidatus Methanogasteraceae archaeon]